MPKIQFLLSENQNFDGKERMVYTFNSYISLKHSIYLLFFFYILYVLICLFTTFISYLLFILPFYYELQRGSVHLAPKMFARLYMLYALQVVLKNTLDILDIKPISQM